MTGSVPLVEAEEGGHAAASLSIADAAMKKEEPRAKLSFISVISYKLFLAGFATSVVSMVLYDEMLIYAAFATSSLVTMFAAYQRRKLDKMEALREVNNRVRREVNRLMIENDHLTRENNKLEIQSNKLNNAESHLTNILSSQGVGVNAFLENIKENQAILDAMKNNLIALVAHRLMSAVMQADRDEDNVIDSEEVKELLFRLSQFDGLDVNEANLRYLLEKKGNSIEAVVSLLKDLMDDQTLEDTVFTVDARQVSLRSLGLA